METCSATAAAGIHREERTPQKRQPEDAQMFLPENQMVSTGSPLTRYDKLDKSFLAFVYMAAIMIWLL